jgi:hypothetical protein
VSYFSESMKDLLMKRVWKVASRWSETGHAESSILDIFRKHNVVFVGKFQDRFQQVSEDDLIAISDGKKVVAMGLATTAPLPITQMGIEFTQEDLEKFDYEVGVIGCRVSFTDLIPEEHLPYRISTFHSVNERANEFRDVFTNHRKRFEEEHHFEIKARTCALFRNEHNSQEVLWQNNLMFRVPIYQRPYSWKEPQVRKLVTDLLCAFQGRNGKAPRERLFIGTMQLSKRKIHDGCQDLYFHEVIDGQQRLSTLLLILKVLKDRKPEDPLLKSLDLHRRIETRVSSGEQQVYLEQALKTDTTCLPTSTQNPYLNVVPLITQLLEEDEPADSNPEENSQATPKPFDVHEFVSFLLSRVYFVVIETRATLSKTLQIFDAINTSGMDLNGGDVFKVRFYEYLRHTKRVKEEAFEEISGLYKTIDEKNRQRESAVCSIEDILSLAQHVLIARHKLPKVLHDYAASTFFDRFFDTILHVNKWENFSSGPLQAVEISIEELKDLITARFEWEDKLQSLGAEARCAMELIEWSRYGKYSFLPILFQKKFGIDRELTERFVIQLSKLLMLFSIWKRRSIYEAHGLLHVLQDKLFGPASFSSAEDVIASLHQESVVRKSLIKETLEKEEIADNVKAKGLVCRLSALLDEISEGNRGAEEVRKLLFEVNIDIEHIESVNHKDGTKRIGIQADWGKELHQIGNLMVLEMKCNRSISNEDYIKAKLPAYANSEFRIVQKHAKEFPTWDLSACRKRKEREVNRLVAYLCGNEFLVIEPGKTNK